LLPKDVLRAVPVEPATEARARELLGEVVEVGFGKPLGNCGGSVTVLSAFSFCFIT
jgi:hypothetical protein